MASFYLILFVSSFSKFTFEKNKTIKPFFFKLDTLVTVVDAVNTGFLSRRWRDLWKYISIVEFDPSWVRLTRKEIVPSLNQFICLHKGQKIQKFSVKFTYKPEMSPSVDSWILFAINKNVEDLELDFDVADNNIIQNTAYAPSYKLPPSIFDSKSIVRLVLCFCNLELPMATRRGGLLGRGFSAC